jgi:signal transduction histidine kinase
VRLAIVKRLGDTRAAAAVLRGALPLAAIVAILVGLILGLTLSRTLVRRLTLLHADAHALGVEGLEHEVRVVGDDEIAEVAGALEEMRTRLAEEEASRQSFVSTASHELRTPLASLQASLELLREDAAGGGEDRGRMVARVDTALRQTHRLVGLAGDLLDLSRVDGRASLRAEPVEVRELVDVVVREFAARFAAAGRTIALAGDPAIVYGDASAVVRIVRILVDNALAYATGAVHVRVAVVEDHVQVSVEDEGPGLGEDERDLVFVRFARGERAREHPGAGLGLSIARGLARDMEGELAAVAAPGGARFVLRLPLWHGE